jgi:hypothetical protein
MREPCVIVKQRYSYRYDKHLLSSFTRRYGIGMTSETANARFSIDLLRIRYQVTGKFTAYGGMTNF